MLSTRREQIKQGLDRDSIEWEKKNKLRSELRKIEKAILGIPPNSGSDDPKLSAGDDLMLPSDSEFKEQAIDHVMETIIYPDIVKNFKTTGCDFMSRHRS